MRIAVCMPCQDDVKASFAMDLAKLVRWTAVQRPDLELVLLQNKGTIIPQQRAVLAEQALAAKADAILWLDSDMRFPRDALLRLMAREEPFVAANYPTRRMPVVPTAMSAGLGYLFTTTGSTGLAEVTDVGFGLVLMDASIFETLPKPWFAIGYDSKDDAYIGEDMFICKRLRAAGIKILVDHDLSHEVQHLGELAFTQQHADLTRTTYLERQAEAASNGVGHL